MVSGVMDAPYTRQYIGTLPYLYFVQQLSQWGLGWPAGIVAWAGLIWALVRFGLGKASAAHDRDAGVGVPLFRRHRRVSHQVPALHGAAAAVPAGLRRGRGGGWLSLAGSALGAAGRIAWVALAVVAAACHRAVVGRVHRRLSPGASLDPGVELDLPQRPRGREDPERGVGRRAAADDGRAARTGRRSAQYERVELPVWDADSNDKLETLAERAGRRQTTSRSPATGSTRRSRGWPAGTR